MGVDVKAAVAALDQERARLGAVGLGREDLPLRGGRALLHAHAGGVVMKSHRLHVCVQWGWQAIGCEESVRSSESNMTRTIVRTDAEYRT